LKEFKDLTGMKFNHLTVISYADYKNHTRYWLCECDCKDKNRKEIAEPLLVLEYTKSCGCILRKSTEKYKKELEEINKKNGTNIKLKEGVEYVKNSIKITHICTCGKEWDIRPNSILNSSTKSCGLCYTFEDFCKDNNKQDILDRWDYDLNNKNPNEITHATTSKYYFKCPKGIHKSEKIIISDITSNKNNVYCRLCNSFEYWCIENERKNILDRWDYDLNKLKPDEISYGSNKKYYFKCPRGIHKSELKSISRFTGGQEGSIKCNQCNSFAQWGIDNLGEDFLEIYWDYEKNSNINPWEISYGSSKQVYIKCKKKEYHGSYPMQCNNFIKGERCGYCKGDKLVHPKDSFAQYLIDLYGDNALELYWDYINNININPWKILKSSYKSKVYIYCQEKDYHDSYPTFCNCFIRGDRCPYCSNRHGKVHKLDSLGTLHPEVLKIWSDKNKKSSYEYAPFSMQQVYWKCPERKHEEYPRIISNSNKCNFRCPECQYSKGEEVISNYFISKGFIKIDQYDFMRLIDENKYNKNYYIPQKTFEGLLGLGNGLLSYDFYLPKYNLLIEYQGEQHERYIEGFHESYDDFLKQVEHDRRKCEYTYNNNINFLEIWYWDYNKIEEILERII